MICKNCRLTNDEDALFCYDCGAELAKRSEAGEIQPENLQPPSFSQVESLLRLGRPAPGATSDPLIGTVIDGRYHVESKLGAGGMGTVYRALRPQIGDHVAVKILDGKQLVTSGAAERFRREAQTTARLKHPNAVSIYDFGTSEAGFHYLVMELVEGQNLRQIIKQRGPLTPSTAVEIIAQACAALDEAHRQGIIHRDLKPDNIIITPTPEGPRVKVLDFGIAKLRDEGVSNLTLTGVVVGTPHYMSPEQCLGEELDARSDVYSLGIILFEALCGVVPFNATTSTAVVVQHVNQPPPSPRALNMSIPPAVEQVAMRALEKRREMRPQSAGLFAQELRSSLNGSMPAQRAEPASTLNFAPTTTPTMVLTGPLSGAHSAAYSLPYTSPAPADTSGSGNRRKYVIAISVGIIFLGVGAGAALLLTNTKEAETPSTRSNSDAGRRGSASGGSAPQVDTSSSSTGAEAPAAMPTDFDVSAERERVLTLLKDWAATFRNRDVEGNVSFYDDYLDAFYQGSAFTKEDVRANRRKIFNRYYSSTEVSLSNVEVSFDPLGQNASISYDNTYNWSGSAGLTGKSHNEMAMKKREGRWLITSEKHAFTYFESKY